MSDLVLSHVLGVVEPRLIERPIGAMLAEAAARDPDGEALVVRHQGVRLTWAELKRRSDAVACGLLAAGVRPGDRVGIWAPNCAEWTILQFATATAGMILVTINPAYRTSEVEYALKKVGCRALVTAVRHKTSDYVAMLRELMPELAEATPGTLRARALPDLRLVATIGEEAHAGCLRFGDLEGAADTALLDAIPIDANDAVNIQFTSGTTGFPKGATLTHRSILNNGYFVGAGIGLTKADRVCIPVRDPVLSERVSGKVFRVLREFTGKIGQKTRKTRYSAYGEPRSSALSGGNSLLQKQGRKSSGTGRCSWPIREPVNVRGMHVCRLELMENTAAMTGAMITISLAADEGAGGALTRTRDEERTADFLRGRAEEAASMSPKSRSCRQGRPRRSYPHG